MTPERTRERTPERTPERIVDLGRRLRGEGLACALSESTAAAAALPHLDTEDVEDVRAGLRATFCSSAADLEIFERCFLAWWREGRPSSAVDDLLSKAAADRGDRPAAGAPSGPDGLAAAAHGDCRGAQEPRRGGLPGTPDRRRVQRRPLARAALLRLDRRRGTARGRRVARTADGAAVLATQPPTGAGRPARPDRRAEDAAVARRPRGRTRPPGAAAATARAPATRRPLRRERLDGALQPLPAPFPSRDAGARETSRPSRSARGSRTSRPGWPAKRSIPRWTACGPAAGRAARGSASAWRPS